MADKLKLPKNLGNKSDLHIANMYCSGLFGEGDTELLRSEIVRRWVYEQTALDIPKPIAPKPKPYNAFGPWSSDNNS